MVKISCPKFLSGNYTGGVPRGGDGSCGGGVSGVGLNGYSCKAATEVPPVKIDKLYKVI